MKKILYILATLQDEDLDWLVSAGQKVTYQPNEKIVQEGSPAGFLVILVDGTANVSANKKHLATCGSGEVIGEISFLDSRPPTATVAAGDEKVVALRIPSEKLRSKMENDFRFASRFYKAIGIFLAQRMRSMTLLATGARIEHSLDEDVEEADEIDFDMLDEVNLAGQRFRMLIDRIKES